MTEAEIHSTMSQTLDLYRQAFLVLCRAAKIIPSRFSQSVGGELRRSQDVTTQLRDSSPPTGVTADNTSDGLRRQDSHDANLTPSTLHHRLTVAFAICRQQTACA